MTTADLICSPCSKCKDLKQENRRLKEKLRYAEETLATERIMAATNEQRRAQREV